MATDVLMPQMGESIAEGTVSRWLKKVGDRVERDEPLLEISTDKVDAEIPSPAAGTLTEMLAQEGETVAVNSVVARISAEGEAAAEAPKSEAAAGGAKAEAEAPAKREAPQEVSRSAKTEEKPMPQLESEGSEGHGKAAGEGTGAPPSAQGSDEGDDSDDSGDENVTSLDERRRTKSSPLVRKIAKENNVDIEQIQGSGVSGRVTKNDILEFLQQPRPAAGAARPSSPAPAPAAPSAPAARPAAPKFASGEKARVEPLSVMRKKIAQHMVLSKQTSAHVSTVFEADFTAIDRLRRAHKDSYTQRGVKLTYMPFVVQAVVAGLKEFPILNASMDENNVIYHRDLNIGIAVALDWGLIVPVLKQADELNILGLSRNINDLGERARTKKLSPDDVQGGTFTITNPGVFGGLFGLPIINQPQVAILGVGGVQKRPVVVQTEDGDSIAIRTMCYISLTFDHRLIDGAVADQFMAKVKSVIEAGQFTM